MQYKSYTPNPPCCGWNYFIWRNMCGQLQCETRHYGSLRHVWTTSNTSTATNVKMKQSRWFRLRRAVGQEDSNRAWIFTACKACQNCHQIFPQNFQNKIVLVIRVVCHTSTHPNDRQSGHFRHEYFEKFEIISTQRTVGWIQSHLRCDRLTAANYSIDRRELPDCPSFRCSSKVEQLKNLMFSIVDHYGQQQDGIVTKGQAHLNAGHRSECWLENRIDHQIFH